MPWNTIGNGSGYRHLPTRGGTPTEVWQHASQVQAMYGRSIQYSMRSLVSFVQHAHDPNLVVLALGLMLAPNTLLPLFWMPRTSEVWIRVAGLVVLNEGVCYWFAAKSDAVPFFRASFYLRCLAPLVFGAFVLAGLARPMLVGFGLVDFVAGIWTILTLRAETRAAPAA